MSRREEKKPYRLLPGKTHRVPNPEFVQDANDPEESHVVAKAGDEVMLTDEQYKSFKDKFAPLSSQGADIRDLEDVKLEAAKVETSKTGQPTDPNKLAAGTIPTVPANVKPS